MVEQVNQALLVVSRGCPHCAAVLNAFSELVKKGELARLEVVNIERVPDIASTHNIRSVPWFSINGLEFQGEYSPGELEAWVKKSASVEGKADYLAERLTTGDLEGALAWVQRDPAFMEGLLMLLGSEQTSTNVRIGLGALLEELDGDELLSARVDAFGKLSQHASPQIRADACHYLGFTATRKAVPWLEACLQDADPDVREIAAESLEKLTGASPSAHAT